MSQVHEIQKSFVQNDLLIVLSDVIINNDSNYTILGNPEIIESPYGKAVAFDGEKDAILFNNNPIAGLESYKIEVIFNQYQSDKFEHRFLHLGEVNGDRLLLETRVIEDKWYFDAFLKSGKKGLTLIDSTLIHPTGEWVKAEYIINANKLSTYINGKKELEGSIKRSAMHSGNTSIGVRQNLVCWFRGAIYSIRISGIIE